MSGDRLTVILSGVLEGKGVTDAEDALDPAHTDALHERELAAAKVARFVHPPEPSKFVQELACAIRFDGPIVEDRWVHAEPMRLK